MSGVYEIFNTVTGRRYVGPTRRAFAKRWKEHRALLNNGRHNDKLQAAWNQYGSHVWEWRILEETTKGITAREQHWIDILNSFTEGYNDSPIAKFPPNKKGIPFTKEHRENISKALEGRVFPHMSNPKSPHMKQALSKIHKGKAPLAAIAIAAKMRHDGLIKPTERELQALSDGRKRPKSPEHRRKIAESNRKTKALKVRQTPATPTQ